MCNDNDCDDVLIHHMSNAIKKEIPIIFFLSFHTPLCTFYTRFRDRGWRKQPLLNNDVGNIFVNKLIWPATNCIQSLQRFSSIQRLLQSNYCYYEQSPSLENNYQQTRDRVCLWHGRIMKLKLEKGWRDEVWMKWVEMGGCEVEAWEKTRCEWNESECN